jgi:WD domain, G-beta repeat
VGRGKARRGRIDKMPPRAVRRPRAASPESESDSGQKFSNATESREGRGASRDSDGGAAPPARKRRLVGETGAISTRESGDGGLPVQNAGAGTGERGSAASTSGFRSREYGVQTWAACLMFCYELLGESDAGVPLAALPPELVELICRFVVSGCDHLMRFDHPDRLECVATLPVPGRSLVRALECVSPADGRQLLAIGRGGDIDLCVLASRECVGTLVGHASTVYSLACFSGGDGAELLASGSWDKTIIVWDVVTRTQLATLSGHKSWVMALAVYSNPSTSYECLASGSRDGTIVLWDPREYCALATLCGHDAPVYSLCVCRNSSGADILASGGSDKVIRDLTTHETLFTLAGHGHAVSSLSVFTNADALPMLVSGCSLGDETLRVWDLESRVSVASVQTTMQLRSLVCVAGADGRVLACCSGGRGDDGALQLYDLSTGESAIELPLLNAAACVAFVDQASGVPYLATSASDRNGSIIIELICARTEETVSP